jgi:hypothetical protein
MEMAPGIMLYKMVWNWLRPNPFRMSARKISETKERANARLTTEGTDTATEE